MSLGIDDGVLLCSMEFEVGKVGACEINGLVGGPAACEDASSCHHQISHALPWKGVEDALGVLARGTEVLDENTAPGALAKAESPRLHHHDVQCCEKKYRRIFL
jgi:hypothetical protein